MQAARQFCARFKAARPGAFAVQQRSAGGRALSHSPRNYPLASGSPTRSRTLPITAAVPHGGASRSGNQKNDSNSRAVSYTWNDMVPLCRVARDVAKRDRRKFARWNGFRLAHLA